ncbi:MAG: integration host factor subunit alpha [Alphaproteobacteria bacterium]|jgi:integration host factor subunit alpha|nr:integration host factor subunit alpha [Alphaproteobacteria bacterium]
MTAETVTRADLINKLTENNTFTRQQAAEILKKTLEEIEKALAKGEHVKISSFGTFSILQKKERIGRNPRTGKDAKISPRRVLSFRASPVFKKSVVREVPLEKKED